VSTLSHLLRGRGAHEDSLRIVEGIGWQDAGRLPPGFVHSIYQIVFHLNYWIDVELKCIESAEKSHPDDWSVSWPATEPKDQAAWQHELALFRTNLGQLATLAEAQASTLARIAHRGAQDTVEMVLWDLVVHNSYHLGQVVQLRQSLGLWPPA
jgi:uncharacterized damage-inducible protein DinB